MKQTIFTPADILLPKDRDARSMEKWSVVACDQYTSDRDYWNAVDAFVGDAPSTLRIILPELYLNDADKDARIAAIGKTTEAYEASALELFPDTMLYIERTMKNGKIRHGVIGAVDLEAYDYNKGSVSAVRATEGTVLSRIPPRVKIRENAVLEAPHVMLLIDDPENRLIGAAAKAGTRAPVYDFDLMQNGGHLAGWTMNAEETAAVDEALAVLGDREAFTKRYGADRAPLVIAVGDGNHSLATAKACYEKIKAALGADAALRHPARWALAEIVNLHDDALEFEPIYRVLFGTTRDELRDAMKAYYPALTAEDGEDGHRFVMLDKAGEEVLRVPSPAAQLPVGTLQAFLDAFLAEHKDVSCDYIHGEDAVRALASQDNTVGFLFDGMEKNDLFRTVIYDGALPRKTFSMGEADEKRYYLECRKIR